MDISELRSQIPNSYFDYQKIKSALKKSTHVRRDIGLLIKRGYLIRIKKGLYTWNSKFNNKIISKEVLANIIYGPSYVSLEYALAYYSLIPERVETITSITTKRKKIFNTPFGKFSYDVLSTQSFPWDTMLIKIDSQITYMIASAEKSLLDTIALKFNQQNILVNSFEKILKEDLRIDMAEYEKLNIDKMIKLGGYYKQSSVKKFTKYLKEVGTKNE